MGYFQTIFKNAKEHDILDPRYPYSLRNMRKATERAREQFAAMRESVEDMSIKNAQTFKIEALGDGQMGSSQLIDYIPQIFTDTIVQFGQRVPVLRRDFPVIPQATNSDFKHRYMFRHDSAGIYREGDEILAAVSKREHDTFGFVKVADSMMYTRELIEDSPIAQISLDTAMGANKVSMLEDRLLAHELTFVSDSAQYPMFTPYNYHSLTDSAHATAADADTIVHAIGEAMLAMTTRLEDPVAKSDLHLYMSPDAYKLIWEDEGYRRWDILGREPVQVTGEVPPLFAIPHTILTPGYFNKANVWVYCPYDIYLVAKGPATLATRTRADQRFEPTEIRQRQMEGWILSERIRPFVINPINYKRISPESLYPEIQPIENILYKPRDLSKTEGTMEMVSITS